MLKNAIKKMALLTGFEIVKSKGNRLDRFDVDPYQIAVLALASSVDSINIAVVGANDGCINDPLYALVKNKLVDKSTILLVEPQPNVVPFLRENYSFHPSHQIVNCAIGDGEHLGLYTVKKEYWKNVCGQHHPDWPEYRAPTGVASLSRSFVRDWVATNILSLKDPDEAIELIEVEVRSLSDILPNTLQRRLHVLQVDAEGFDDEVLYACELGKTQPSLIYYESKCLPKQRSAELRVYLGKLGYEIFELGANNLCIRC